MSSVRISRKAAETLLAIMDTGVDPDAQGERRAAEDLRRALTQKPKSSLRKKTERKRRTKRDETAEVRKVVMDRAAGGCECCGAPEIPSDPLELDHFFGKGKVRQTPENCWALLRSCHRRKTDSIPSAAHWLNRFIGHCEDFGFSAEASRAEARLYAIETTRGAK